MAKYPIETIRHSAAHVMAAAVQKLFGDVKFDIGPSTSDGFYYDFDMEHRLSMEDLAAIENEIVTMPNYFADYDTTVHFISKEELERDHSGIPHGGVVIRSGTTGFDNGNNHVIEFSLKLDSNPQFTSSVLVAYARAAYRLGCEGAKGCKTVFDIAPAYLHPETPEELRKKIL